MRVNSGCLKSCMVNFEGVYVMVMNDTDLVLHWVMVRRRIMAQVLEAKVRVEAFFRVHRHAIKVVAGNQIIVETIQHGRCRKINLNTQLTNETTVMFVVSSDAKADLMMKGMMSDGHRASSGTKFVNVKKRVKLQFVCLSLV